MSDLAAKNAHDVAWEVVERPDMAPADRNKVFLRRIMETPRIYQVWYEPGYVYPRHQHPVDEIFYILRGDFTINGHDLREGSMIYVPKNTKYGPEYTGKDGVLFLRVELWDTEEGPPGSQARGVNIKAWTGGETADGLPDVPGPKAAPAPDEQRSLETAEATRSVSAADRPWMETTREMSDGRQATTYCSRNLMAPTPSVTQVLHRPRYVQPLHQHEVDECFYFLRGELEDGDLRLTPGSVYFIPKNTPYGGVSRTDEGALYLRIVLQDSKAKRETVPSGIMPRPWSGPLDPEGVPVLTPSG